MDIHEAKVELIVVEYLAKVRYLGPRYETLLHVTSTFIRSFLFFSFLFVSFRFVSFRTLRTLRI